MREAIGGTWIMGIVIVFVVLFASFLAYSISYSKAFNVKNEIINYIEHKEGYTRCLSDCNSNVETVSESKLEQIVNDKSKGYVDATAYYYILKTGYNKEVAGNIICPNGKQAYPGGYCLEKICQKNSDPNSNFHYKITTYIAVELPVLNIIIKIPISGETRTIYTGNVNDKEPCY